MFVTISTIAETFRGILCDLCKVNALALMKQTGEVRTKFPIQAHDWDSSQDVNDYGLDFLSGTHVCPTCLKTVKPTPGLRLLCSTEGCGRTVFRNGFCFDHFRTSDRRDT